jgi:hypothetical protein
MSSFSVKRFEEGGLATANGDEGIDGVLPSLLEGATIADINAAAARQFASQDRMKALIDEAKARISQQRAPSVFGALSEGLAQPKTQPGISGTLANISSGLSTYRKGKSAFDEAQAEKLLAYQLKQEELQGARATTEGTTATRLATLRAAQAKADAEAKAVDVKQVTDGAGNVWSVGYDKSGKEVSRSLFGKERSFTPGKDETRDGIKGYINKDGIWTPYPEYAQSGAKAPELPQGVLNRKTAIIGDAGLFARTASEAERLVGLIDSGDLKLGPIENAASVAKGLAGRSDDNAVNYADLQRFVNESVNAVLNTAKGVQAKDDAVRAKKQILQHLNDPKIVASALRDLNRIMLDNVSVRDAEIASIYRNYKAEPLTVWDELGVDAPANYKPPKTAKLGAQGSPAAGAASAAAPNANALALARALAQRKKLQDAALNANAAGVP